MSRRSHRLHRLVRAGAALLVAGTAGLAAILPAAGQEDPFAPDAFDADAPVTAALLQFGWWNKAQQSPAGGNPTPPPPGAPENGIFILYGPTGVAPPAAVTGPIAALPTAPAPAPVPSAPIPLGPEAYGAVRYAVPLGSEATLTLRYVPTSTSQPGGVNPDVGELFACPTTRTWDPVQNGRYDGAPTYDCGTGVPAVVAGDSVTFAFPSSLAVDGVFDVALVPMGTRPYRLALNTPTDESLALTSVPEQESTGEESFDPGTFEDPVEAFEDPVLEDSSTFGTEDFGAVGVDEFSAGTSTGDFDVTTSPGVPSGSVRRPATQVAQPAAIANPFRRDASRSERIMAVAVLAALAAGLFWIGGKPVRAPRLLGSLGAGQVLEFATEVKTGGIGRFARVRTGAKPPRLF